MTHLAHFLDMARYNQTHHRGQVTAMLSMLGSDPGMTDFLIVEHLPA